MKIFDKTAIELEVIGRDFGQLIQAAFAHTEIVIG